MGMNHYCIVISMSTNNIVLNPPTPIQVGNDIDESNHNHIPTEVKTNKGQQQHAASTSTSSSSSSSSLLFDRENTTHTARDTSTAVYSSTRMASPDIDREIRGFQQELDTLSKSFDHLATSYVLDHSQKKRALASSETSRNHNNTATATATTRMQHTAGTTTTTPAYRSSVSVPFSSPHINVIGIGGATRTGKSNTRNGKTGSSRSVTKTDHGVGDVPATKDETFLSHSTTTTTTRFQEEPRPVDTPMVASTRAGGTRTSHRYDDDDDDDVGDIDAGIGEDQCNTLGKSSENFEGTTIKRMKEAMKEKNYTIRQLQRENNDLRRRLLFAQGANTAHDPNTHNKGKQQRQNQHQRQNYSSRLEPMFDGTSNRLPRNNLDNNSNSTSSTRYNNYDRSAAATKTTTTAAQRPEGYMGSSFSTYRSTQLSTPLRHEDENAFEATPRVRSMHTTAGAGFTPGTKFVAVSSIQLFVCLFTTFAVCCLLFTWYGF